MSLVALICVGLGAFFVLVGARRFVVARTNGKEALRAARRERRSTRSPSAFVFTGTALIVASLVLDGLWEERSANDRETGVDPEDGGVESKIATVSQTDETKPEDTMGPGDRVRSEEMLEPDEHADFPTDESESDTQSAEETRDELDTGSEETDHEPYTVPSDTGGQEDYIGPEDNVGSEDYVGPKDYVGPEDYVGPQDYVGPKDYVGPEDQIGPKDYVGPEDRVGPKDYVGPEDRVGPKDYIGPEDQIGPKDYVGPEDYVRP